MRKADRGEDAVSVVIGAVLMLGLLMTLLAVLQTTAVPIWNEDTEFSHSQNVQEDIQSLGSAISFVSSSGTPRSVTVDMGVEYTDRVVLQNPPDASGTLRSIDGYLNISNAQVESSRETHDYWDGSKKAFETRIITYSPDYNRYQDAPSTVYGNSMVYNYWSGIADARYNANLTLSEQSMINGRNINLVMLNGSISTSQVESKTVSLKPNSVTETTIAATDDGDPITLTITSPLTAANWTSALQDEINNGNVVDVSDTGNDYNGLNKLEITLESDKTYNLRMAEVGIQQGREVPEYYLTDIEGNDTTVLTGSSQKLVAEVRDKYNNPVSGVTVNGSADDGSLANSQRFSTSDGTVTFDYTAPSNSGTDYVNISMDSDPASAGSNFQPRQKENVSFYLDVDSGGNGGGGGGGGGGVVSNDRIVYTESNNQELRTISVSDKSIGAYTTNQVKAIGPMDYDVDGDGKEEIPYSTGSNNPLKLIDRDNDKSELDKNIKHYHIGVGNWDGNLRVIYVGNNNKIRQASTTTTDIIKRDNTKAIKGKSIAGVGDFDKDGSNEIVYVSESNSKVTTIETDGGKTDPIVKLNDGTNAVSDVADFDDDNTMEIAHVDGNNKIELIESNGDTQQFTLSGQAKKSPLGAVDWTGDGIRDVIYISYNNQEIKYLNATSGDTGFVNKEDGSHIKASGNPGVS